MCGFFVGNFSPVAAALTPHKLFPEKSLNTEGFPSASAMRCAMIGFAAGAAILQNCAALPEALTLAGLATVGLLLCFLRGAALAGMLFGFCWAAMFAHLALAPQLAPADEGRDITLTGTIDSLPYHFDQGVRFNFAVEKAQGNSGPIPPRIALAWYAGFGDGGVGNVQPGERWQLTVRLQRPHGNANPHGFDYEVWLLEQGLRATGYVRPEGPANRQTDSFVFGFSNVVEHCRATLRERIRRALAGKEYAGVIVALVVGDQRAISHVSLHLSR